MQSNDKPINGRHNPTFPDLLNQPPEPPASDPDKEPGKKRFARLRAGWDASWEEGGFLYERWEEVLQARQLGLRKMAHWIKAVLALAGLCTFIIVLDAAGDIVSAMLHRLSVTRTMIEPLRDGTTGRLWGVIDHPVHSYIAQHSTGLAVPGSTVYAFWQVTGLIGLIGGFAGSSGARILWTGWGLASTAMVWSAAPDGSRTVATGIAALLWALASIVALRGLSLRPLLTTPIPAPPPVNLYPVVHIPPQPAPVLDDLDDEPDDTLRPLHH